MHIGTYLKELRNAKGFTLSHVADNLHLSASFLSQIENEKISPSLNSLDELLKFYNVSLSDFFKQVEQKKCIIVKHSEVETLDDKENGVKLSLLASKLQNNTLESYIVELKEGAEIETAVLSKDINSERIIYIMKGAVQVKIENENPYNLEYGDSINYKSYVQCKIKNAQSMPAEMFISGFPPIFL
jgi:transcriptional regulator with XRE-family HTH domain